VDLLGPLARQKSIDIQVDVEEIINVFADIETINLVIRNLLSNAIKFTPCNGKIIVKACDDGEKVVVSVEDNGVGMDPGVLESLFKPDIFFTTYGTENEKGSGLGLILCKDFVEKNGGNIIVESESGKGSRFIFTVPRE
jgi:signal transduction histidine kinase